MEKITKEERKELHEKQPAPCGTPFAPANFICYCCKKDILEDKETLRQARAGEMITGCPLCNRSYCD